MDVENYKSINHIGEALLLPDEGRSGQWFVYLLRTNGEGNRRELRVGHTENGDTSLITAEDTLSQLRQMPSTGSVSYTSQVDSNGDDAGRSIYTVDPLSENPEPTKVEIGLNVRNYAWGTDAGKLSVVTQSNTDQNSPKSVIDPANAPSVRPNGKATGEAELYVVDRGTGESNYVTELGRYQSIASRVGYEPAVNSDDVVAFIDVREDGTAPGATDLHTVTPDGNVDQLTNGELVIRGPSWSPDGERLSFYAENALNPYDTANVYLYSPSEGIRNITQGFNRSVVGPPVWVDDSTVAFLAGDEGQVILYRSDVQSGSITALTPDIPADESITAFDTVGTKVLTVRSHASSTPTLQYTDTRKEKTSEVLSTTPPFVERHPSLGFRRLSWDTNDGTTVEGLLYKPPDRDPPYPTIVSLHGGPVAFDYPEYIFDYAYWVDDGYAVFCPNYRGSSSYGREFMSSIADGWGPKETKDVILGTRNLLKNDIADPNRLYVTGYSYGATLTVRVLAASDLFVAGVAEQGVYDFRSAFGGTDAHDMLERHLGTPWEHPERYEMASVVTDVEKITDPVLLFAAGEDRRTPPSQSRQLYVALRRTGTPARLVRFDRTGHGFESMSIDRLKSRLQEFSDWFDFYTEGSL